MRDQLRVCALIFLVVLGVPLAGQGQSPPPRIFFTDLESGPNTGGENNNGTILTLYGNFFGATRGTSTVTIGGGAAADYKLWSDTKIAVAIGSAAASGNIIVTVGGAPSNALPFTVRSGNIRCVSTSGSDSASGNFGSCWGTISHAIGSTSSGDIVYAMNGVSESGGISIGSSGSSGSPKALVAYPGATVNIGTPSNDAIRGGGSDWVFAGLRLTGSVFAIEDKGSNWRIVGNYATCPHGNTYEGCLEVSQARNIKVYGNEVTGVSSGLGGPSTKLYHAVYFTTDANSIDMGWNHVHDNNTCRAIQFHSSPLGGSSGQDQYDLHVHDNRIHGDRCDGINFATVDPSKGTVEAYNNLIYDVGTGPDSPEGYANYACIVSLGYTNNGTKGSGQIRVYNNTLYNCGARGGGGDGAFGSFDSGAGLSLLLQNNIVYLTPGESYIESGSGLITGSNNLWFGAGGGPTSGLANNVSADPKFVSTSTRDFHLQAGSPAIDAGLNTGLATDFDGVSRPQGKAFDLGALEFPGTTTPTAQKPNPPANLRVVVQ